MFLGEYNHSLDSKGRLTIPAKFRDQLATGLVVTRNPSERCLLALPQAEWERVAGKVNSLPMMDSHSGLLRRAFFSAAEGSQAGIGRAAFSLASACVITRRFRAR